MFSCAIPRTIWVSLEARSRCDGDHSAGLCSLHVWQSCLPDIKNSGQVYICHIRQISSCHLGKGNRRGSACVRNYRGDWALCESCSVKRSLDSYIISYIADLIRQVLGKQRRFGTPNDCDFVASLGKLLCCFRSDASAAA